MIKLSIRDLENGDRVEFRKSIKIANNITVKKGTRAYVGVYNSELIKITVSIEGREHILDFNGLDVKEYLRKPKGKNAVIKGVAIHDDVKLVIRNNRSIIVVLETNFKGRAVCDEESEWNPDNGYMIAYFKAKKKEADYRYRVDKAQYRASIKAAQLMLRDIEKNHFKTNKVYDHYIRMAIKEVKVKPPKPSQNF